MVDITCLSQLLWVRNSGSAWLGGSSSVSHESIANIFPELQSPEGLPGDAFLRCLTHRTGKLVFLHMGLSMALLECLHNVVAGPPQSSDPGGQTGDFGAFYDSLRNQTLLLLLYSICLTALP